MHVDVLWQKAKQIELAFDERCLLGQFLCIKLGLGPSKERDCSLRGWILVFFFGTLLYSFIQCLQCFHTVGWAAGRASGL